MRHRLLELSLRRAIILILTNCLLMTTLPLPASAAALRGKVDRIYPNGQRGPLAGVTVTVYRQDLGRSAPVVTDTNGMYYLNVPAGVYWLEIWVSNPPRAYQISVVEPYTDIPPILA